MDQPTSLLNTSQLAIWLGVSNRTVCLWAECSELPAIKVGRQWRFKREAIQRWLDGGRTPMIPKKEIAAVAATTAYNSSGSPV